MSGKTDTGFAKRTCADNELEQDDDAEITSSCSGENESEPFGFALVLSIHVVACKSRIWSMTIMRPALMTFGIVAVLACAAAHAEEGQQASLNVQQLFATSCGWCHQSGGRSEGRGPKLAGTDKSDEYIINQIKKGKPPGMPSFGGSFNDVQINAILAYIRNLKDEP